MGERIILHPESSDDFTTDGGYDPDDPTEFRQFVHDPSPFTTTLRQRTGGFNSIYMSGNSGTVSGMTLERLQEMSAYRDGDTEDPNRLSGLYQVSVIILPRYDTGYPLPNDDATHVLNVRFRYTYPITGATVYLNCPLEGRQLWEGDPGARTRRTGVQEIVIGQVEVQQTDGRQGGDVIFVDQGDLVNHGGWTRTGMDDVRGPRRLREHGEFHLQEIRGDFDVQIFYGDDDVHLWLDAVCLTNPATFGLWHPDNPGTLPVHTGYRAAMDNRMAFLLRNNDPNLAGVGGIPGLRFVMGEEQVFNNGTYWTTFLLSRLIADETDDHVQMFSTYGSWTNTELTPVLAAEMITGPYNYPLLTDHPRPTLQGMTAQNYLTPLYDVNTWPDGFRGMWGLFLANMHTRSLFAPDQPWIPFIQNHTNLAVTNPPAGWWDGVPNREPSASELRFECNTALAFGASGVLFYAFSSIPYMPDQPTIPPTVFAADRILPNPAAGVDWFDPIDMNAGTMGFLGSEGVEDVRRILDWNGENKWDSTQAYIHDFLEPVGSYISQHLRWQTGLQWYCRGDADAGSCDLVSMIVSRRQDIPDGIDPQEQTFVMVSEFERNAASPPPESSPASRFLFVVNGNTFDGPLHAGVEAVGQRHITVKLGTDGGLVDEWRVTNVLSGDIHVVRASDAPDETSYANGFTEYFAPGAAALYRLDPMVGETIDFNPVVDPPPPCPMRSIYIEPAAMLRLKSTDDVSFGLGKGLFCDGTLIADHSTFRSCDLEVQWDGIIARNGGSVSLEGATLYNAGVVAGSGGSVTLDESCAIHGANVAMFNCDATLTSTATQSTSVYYHLSSVGYGCSNLQYDIATGNGLHGSTAIITAFTTDPYPVQIDECTFSGFWRGVHAYESVVRGDVDWTFPPDCGNNSIRCKAIGLHALENSLIDLGDGTYDFMPESYNEIIYSDPQGFSAVTDATSGIDAVWNWWEPTLRYSGNLGYDPTCILDPIPLTRSGGETVNSPQQLVAYTPPPPPGIRGQVKAALRQHDHGAARHIIGQFLQSSAALDADFKMLRFIHGALRFIAAPAAIDSLLTLCLARSDLDSKLLAADIAAADSLYVDALAVLNAYSFAGSPALLKRALIRKSLLYPRAKQGGYRDGVLALDSLRGMNDSLLLRFIDLYPLLYSRLSRPLSSSIPKRAAQPLIERALPVGIEVWPNYPNPFTDVTSFTFKLGEATHVRLAIYDAMGREVAVVTNADYDRGVHSAVLRAGALPSGLYFSRLTTDKGVTQRKMMLMR